MIQAAAEGSPEGRDEFSRRYLPTVRAYLSARFRHTGMMSDLDDAVQEVFVACFRNQRILTQADPERGFREFLHGVARNVARNMERAKARRQKNVPAGDVDPQVLPARDQQLSRLFDREYARLVMRDAGAMMAARAREAGGDAVRRVELLELRFEAGLPIRAIARRWQTDADRLHREYAKASREFKSALCAVVGLAERCAPGQLDAECDRLLWMLR